MASWYYLSKIMKRKSNHACYTEPSECLIKSKDDLNFKCRVCLRKGTIEIFEGDDTSNIVEGLLRFGDIQVSEYDDNPKLLCEHCYKFIKAAILFLKTARKCQELMKQPLKKESLMDQEQDDQESNRSYSDIEESESKPQELKWPVSPDIENNVEIIKKEKKVKNKFATKVTCHICNKVINRSYFKEHVTMHDPDHKKYVCDVCGKSFRLRCAYHNHSLRHRSDFPYKCTFCPYRGRYAELLKTHMRTHTGDYRYMCTECPARFLFKSNLNSHMLKHKEPQFKCDSCKRAFHTTVALQRHFEADHLGIKNHVCNICGKAFGYRNAMMKHQRHVHKREKLLFGRMPSYLEAENKLQDVNML